MHARSARSGEEPLQDAIVPRLDVALPSELLRIDVKMPTLHIDVFLGTLLGALFSLRITIGPT